MSRHDMRRENRRSCTQPVGIMWRDSAGDDKFMNAPVRDISASGVGLQTPEPVPGRAPDTGPAGVAHDVITTRITWDREITRLVYSRCASCHREGGSAFSLMTYADGRPWAVAMKEEVLARRMPPWGAIKGFGDYRNDQALTPEQMEIIVSWVDGG